MNNRKKKHIVTAMQYRWKHRIRTFLITGLVPIGCSYPEAMTTTNPGVFDISFSFKPGYAAAA